VSRSQRAPGGDRQRLFSPVSHWCTLSVVLRAYAARDRKQAVVEPLSDVSINISWSFSSGTAAGPAWPMSTGPPTIGRGGSPDRVGTQAVLIYEINSVLTTCSRLCEDATPLALANSTLVECAWSVTPWRRRHTARVVIHVRAFYWSDHGLDSCQSGLVREGPNQITSRRPVDRM